MRLVDAASPVFARHETFHPRYGWFRKAYEAAAEDPSIFSREEAPVEIGVGKNMVRSIRFWGLAAKLLNEDAHPSAGRTRQVVPARFAYALFGPSGWDPYMEDRGTLWLLHWRMMSPPCRLPVWWLAFNDLNTGEFCEDDLLSMVLIALEVAAEWKDPSSNSVRKDISALLRTYGPVPANASARAGIDDILDCPMRELRLITRSPISDNFRFTSGAKPSLPAEIVVFASLDFVMRAKIDANTVAVSRLSNESGGPGRAFRLSETDMLATLESAAEDIPHLSLSASVGAPFLSWSIPPQELADEILNGYYSNHRHVGISGLVGDLPIDDDLLDELGLGRSPSDKFRQLHELTKAEKDAAA